MTLREVVFPDPVPPETRMFIRPRTQARRKSAIAGLSDPSRRRSSISITKSRNLRIVSEGPRSAAGRMMALIRLPSGRRASTIGLSSSMWRPVTAIIRRIVSNSWPSSWKRASAFISMPSRST